MLRSRKSVSEKQDGNTIVNDIFKKYFSRLKAGRAVGNDMKNRLESATKLSGVNCIAVTMGDLTKPMTDYENISCQHRLVEATCT